MKTKFIYVVLAVLFMGSQMTLSAQEKDNKRKETTSYTGTNDADADQSNGESTHVG